MLSGGMSQVVPESSKPIDSKNVGVRQAPIDAFVAGSLAIDLSCDFKPNMSPGVSQMPQAQTSNPASITQSLGGVGQNVAQAIHYLGPSVQLCSVVGDDIAGSAALQMLSAEGLSQLGVIKKNRARTAQYVAFNDDRKDLVMAMADMSILEDDYSEEFEMLWEPALQSGKAKWLVVDANWSPPALQRWIAAGQSAGTKIAFEPVSSAKSQRLFHSTIDPNSNLGVIPDHTISLVTPNSLELASMHVAAQNAGLFERDDWWQVIDSMGLSSSGSRDKLVSVAGGPLVDAGTPQQSIQLLPFFPSILTKLGENGVLMTQILQPGDDRLTSPIHSQYILSRADISNSIVGGVYMRLFSAVEQVPGSEIVSVNGVGDTFLGILIAGLTKDNPKPLNDLVNAAQQGSVMTLRKQSAVNPEIRQLRNFI